jgi:hypothetical protein
MATLIDYINITSAAAVKQRSSVKIYLPVVLLNEMRWAVGDGLVVHEDPFRMHRADFDNPNQKRIYESTNAISYRPRCAVEDLVGKWSYEVEGETVYLLERISNA